MKYLILTLSFLVIHSSMGSEDHYDLYLKAADKVIEENGDFLSSAYPNVGSVELSAPVSKSEFDSKTSWEKKSLIERRAYEYEFKLLRKMYEAEEFPFPHDNPISNLEMTLDSYIRARNDNKYDYSKKLGISFRRDVYWLEFQMLQEEKRKLGLPYIRSDREGYYDERNAYAKKREQEDKWKEWCKKNPEKVKKSRYCSTILKKWPGGSFAMEINSLKGYVAELNGEKSSEENVCDKLGTESLIVCPQGNFQFIGANSSENVIDTLREIKEIQTNSVNSDVNATSK